MVVLLLNFSTAEHFSDVTELDRVDVDWLYDRINFDSDQLRQHSTAIGRDPHQRFIDQRQMDTADTTRQHHDEHHI